MENIIVVYGNDLLVMCGNKIFQMVCGIFSADLKNYSGVVDHCTLSYAGLLMESDEINVP